MNVNIAEWVQGNTGKGELIHGFVESVDLEKGIVKVHVVASDNEEAVGTAVYMLSSWVKALKDTSVKEEQQLRMLIDLALETDDEAWFMELTGQLKSLGRTASAPERGLEANPRIARIFGLK
ncbi:hypothetical protein BG53_01890 [Paenibacillus darwinianus]|uniref:IDEAL domain-containing protein n=1 Tax=Paenibacillus darwinianus TaxID=1380763 RepID=A0A9W5S1M9_9BACL|nr:IDEAL domain-containing protein [Paenibacillus darwinianus]EXX87517.1 hypothetical protein BG52_03915 [Paenibacillus darwinianus]EXX88493.1 hypothetical protein BG53_01890 [Paenibacillus darwinianus]EXX88699.1 hypothetical protein CH50_02900 [Paenibacillus darwinianus]